MGTTYKLADVEATLLMEDVRDRFHPGLVEAQARVCLMFAYGQRDPNSDELVAPALKLHGARALAIVKINNLAKRAEGMADATVTADGDEWPGWPEERRRALLDHELHHLVVRRGKKSGVILRDDLDRPKFAMRPHDFEVGWFKEIALRHGAASVECEQVRALVDSRGQLLFPWAPAADARGSESAVLRDAVAAIVADVRSEQEAAHEAPKPSGRRRAAAKGGPPSARR